MTDLRYPIGKFQFDGEGNGERRRQFVPMGLRIIAGLNGYAIGWPACLSRTNPTAKKVAGLSVE